jgi:hypothetical protein
MATSFTLQNDPALPQGYLKVDGSTSATFTTSGITGNLTGNVTGNLTGSLTQGGSLTFATTQTATGTAVDFTGIPSWAKRITVILSGVSTSGTSFVELRIGAGSISSTGYLGAGVYVVPPGVGGNASTSGFQIPGQAGSNIRSGICILTKQQSDLWIAAFNGTYIDITGSFSGGGNITLSGVLDRIRITTVDGTDTFDAGTINICYEG